MTEDSGTASSKESRWPVEGIKKERYNVAVKTGSEDGARITSTTMVPRVESADLRSLERVKSFRRKSWRVGNSMSSSQESMRSTIDRAESRRSNSSSLAGRARPVRCANPHPPSRRHLTCASILFQRSAASASTKSASKRSSRLSRAFPNRSRGKRS